MLLVYQFPVADTRPFVSAFHQRLEKPHWPSPRTDTPPQFVHFFGKAVDRRRGADEAFTDELTFCLARRGIRFKDLGSRLLGLPAAAFSPALAFRRLFCDGRTVVRVEIGVTHDERRRHPKDLNATQVLQIASEASAVQTWVPVTADAERAWKPLLGQGKNLAQLYARGSKPRKNGVTIALDPLVTAGRPLLLIELESRKSITLPSSFTAVDAARTRGALLHFGRLQTTAGVVATWVVQPGTAVRADLRSLRLCLLRLHAERECLDVVLNQIHARRIPEAVPDDAQNIYADELNRYLNVATRVINGKEWSSGISQSAIIDAYDAAESVTPAAKRSLLTTRFDGARRQVWLKVEDYQERRAATRVVQVTRIEEGATYVDKNITITNNSGVINIAEYMNNVTNAVNNNLQQSTAPAELQALVKQLTEQIKEISTKVDSKTTQSMADEVKALSENLAKEEPKRRWYEVSLEGLKEAAQAVGELGKPILETVKALTPLLLPA